MAISRWRLSFSASAVLLITLLGLLLHGPGVAWAQARDSLTIIAGSAKDHPDAMCLFIGHGRFADYYLSKLEALALDPGKSPDGVHLLCACNSLQGSICTPHPKNAQKLAELPSKVLFVQVFSVPREPEQTYVSLDGSLFHIVGRWTVDHPPQWVTSLATSEYVEQSVPVMRQNPLLDPIVVLPLVPTKMVRELMLPEIDAGEKLTATISYLDHKTPQSRELTGPGGNVKITIPSSVTDFTIDVARDDDACALPVARYVAHLSDPNTSGPVPIRAQQILFRWRPQNCLYEPSDKMSCPRASIPAAGVPCVPTYTEGPALRDGVEPRGMCSYECELPGSSGTFEFPAEVRLSVGTQDDAWTERVVRLNQLMEGAPSRETRQFEVRFPWDDAHPEHEPLFNELVHADLFAPDGRAFRIEAKRPGKPNPARVNVPGATCDDRLTYRYYGKYQSFESGGVSLKHGGYTLDPPKDTFRTLWLGFRGSYGAQWGLGPPRAPTPVHPSGEIENRVAGASIRQPIRLGGRLFVHARAA